MQVTEILQVIKPYVLGWIETGGEEGGYAPSPHELDGAHHIGTLATSQYPDALLRDGSRSLTGNLSVGAGVTIDGVDLGAFKSDYDSHILTANAHHNQVSLDANADAVLSLSVQQIGLDTQVANRIFAGPTSGGAAVPTFRALVAADIPALGGTPALTFTTSNAAGSASTYVRTDASLAIFDATAPTTIQPDDAAAAGSAAFAARRDHKHAIVAAAPGNQAIGDSATEGTATSFARSDHRHGMPAFATPSVILGAAAAAGSATTLLRSDATIAAFDATAPTTIQPDDAAAVGSAAYAARRDHKHAIAAAAPGADSVNVAASAEGTATSFARSDHAHNIDEAIAPVWTGLHTFRRTTEQVRIGYDAANYVSITVNSGGDVTIDPTGADITLDSDLIFTGSRSISEGFTSGAFGAGYEIVYNGTESYIEIDNMTIRGTLRTHIFQYDIVRATNGYLYIADASEITHPASGSYIYCKENVFQAGDLLWYKDYDLAAGSIDSVKMTVVSADGGVVKDGKTVYQFTVTVYSGSLADLDAGGTVVRVGNTTDASRQGALFMDASSTYAPFMDVYDGVDGWAAFGSSEKVKVRIGNLDGVLGLAQQYGIAAGQDMSDPTAAHLIASDQGVSLYGIAQEWWRSDGTKMAELDPTASGTGVLFGAGPDIDSGDYQFKILADGTTWLSTLAISEQMGDLLFSLGDGLALWGPGCAISTSSWTSTRAQVAALSGAFHRVQGTWANSRALLVEVGATNLITSNPSFESGTTGWTTGGTNTIAQSTDISAIAGTYVCKATYQDTISLVYYPITLTAIAHSLSMYVWVPSSYDGTHLRVRISNFTGATGAIETAVDMTKRNQWQRVTTSATIDAGDLSGSLMIYEAGSAPTAGRYVYIDAAQCEATAYATSFTTGTRTATVVNLDAHAGMLSDLNTVTHSVWIQAQYDADDASWPCGANNARIFDYRGADANNHVNLRFDPNIDDQFAVYINGASRITVTNQTFVAGDWLHLAVTEDFTNDLYYLYLNGILIGSSTATLTAPTALVNWKLGASYNSGAGFYGGWAFGEYAVFGRALTAEEVASIYAQNRPLVDGGAFRRPGIYILDGEIDLRTAQSGARVQIDATGVGGYSATAVKTFSLETDGDFFAGSDISAAATTALAVFANAQTYNSESMGAGDLLMGDNSAGKFNVKWDLSEGDLLIRRGTSTRIALDASADSIVIGDATGYHTSISSGGILLMKNATTVGVSISSSYVRVGDTMAATDYFSISTAAASIVSSSVSRFSIAAGVMTINDSSGAAVFTFDASAGAQFSKALTLGANGGIYQGSGTFASPTTGLKIWNDSGYGKIGAYYSSVLGTALDSNGLSLFSDTAYTASKALKFYDGGTLIAEIFARTLGTPLFANWLEIDTEAVASMNTNIRIRAQAPASYVGQVSLDVSADGLSPYLRLSNYGSTYESLETNCVIAIFNSTAAPSSSVTNGVLLYAQDVSSSSELRVRDEAGNVTTLSPHNFSLIPAGASEPLAWAYYAERDGVAINVDMLKLARLVERLTGEQLVYIRENLN